MMRQRITLLVSLVFMMGASARPTPIAEVLPCSLINLIASPERYDGKRVQVIGFLTTGLENEALYLTADDARITNTMNAVAIEIHDGGSFKLHEHVKALTSGFAIVEGTFSSKDKGHLDLFPGAIVGITRLDPLVANSSGVPSQTKPRRK